MKVIIGGSRNIDEYANVIDAVVDCPFVITEVVSGNAKGVDSLGIQYAKDHNKGVKIFNAKWKDINVEGAVIRSNAFGKYNARAGFDRNEKMGDYADALIAIYDGKSKGTAGMIKYMKSLGKPVYVFVVNS